MPFLQNQQITNHMLYLLRYPHDINEILRKKPILINKQIYHSFLFKIFK